MNRTMREYLPGILNGVLGIGVLLVSILVELRLPMPAKTAKSIGIGLVALGMLLVIWATVYIKGAIAGEVEPRLQKLVQEGPYQFVRHPVYLGITIALLGVALTTRSWLGMLCVLLLFLPSEIYRARLEDRALSLKFGSEWQDYAARTGFILPFIGKTKRADFNSR